MTRRTCLLAVLIVAASAAGGCHALDTFNFYPRINVQDFMVVPGKEGRVAPEHLTMLKETSIRWLQNGGLFSQVAADATGGPETVFVQGTVYNYRPHRSGTRALAIFTGVDIQGESLIFYRFYDSTGRTILERRVSARFQAPPPGIDATAEAAGCELARLVSWHKNIRS